MGGCCDSRGEGREGKVELPKAGGEGRRKKRGWKGWHKVLGCVASFSLWAGIGRWGWKGLKGVAEFDTRSV